ncbi:MAG: hypothetical protein NXI26_24195 [bacterium]|nr:hypothetical protein [bacterium]
MATIHLTPASLDQAELPPEAEEVLRRKGPIEQRYLDSLYYYIGLVHAQTVIGRDFDIIEFPDLSGWGACAIAAKSSGMAFQNTLMSIRLHSSFGLIYLAEPGYHIPSDWVAAVFDIERKAMRDADLIVGHLDDIVTKNAEVYGLPHIDEGRYVVERPPIILDDAEESVLDVRHHDETVHDRIFVFSSRLQPFKRPDIFIKAAVMACDQGVSRDTKFIIASYGWDNEYIFWLKGLIPDEYDSFIRFEGNLSPSERVLLLARSTVVIPSIFESYCVFAYECAARGTPLILASDCGAFTDKAGWKDAQNCQKFDGTAEHLAEIFLQPSIPLKKLQLHKESENSLYWHNFEECSSFTKDSLKKPQKIALLCWGFSRLQEIYLLANRMSREESGFSERIFVISRTLAPINEIRRLTAAIERAGMHAIISSSAVPDQGGIVEISEKLDIDWLTSLPLGWSLKKEYAAVAAKALSSGEKYVGFTCQYLQKHNSTYSVVKLGEAPSLLYYSSVGMHAASTISVSFLKAVPISGLGKGWLHAVMSRAVLEGKRIAFAPAALATREESSPEEEDYSWKDISSALNSAKITNRTYLHF